MQITTIKLHIVGPTHFFIRHKNMTHVEGVCIWLINRRRAYTGARLLPRNRAMLRGIS